MPSLVLDNYSAAADSIRNEFGNKSCPIWLIINPKSSSVYEIWNPILDRIQDKVYRELRKRIDKQRIYIKNITSDIGIVPKNINGWKTEVGNDLKKLKESILEYQPKIIITFGNLTCELVNRFFKANFEDGPRFWRTTNLGTEFERSIANFNINRTNRIPLPSRVNNSNLEENVYSGWEVSEPYLCDAALKIAAKIIENKDRLDVWID